MTDALPVAVLISGRGSNMTALAEACAADDFPARIVAVISNRPDAAGLAIAAGMGLNTAVIDHRDFADRAAFEGALDRAARDAGADLLCLAGFMRVLTESFVESWRDRLVNIHPSLLPSFKGLDTHERALAAGVRITGCTVHFVRAATDSGPIIVQAAVPVRDGDDAGALAARVLAVEHRIYPMALRWIAEGRVRIDDEVVRIDGAQAAEGALLNPAG